MADPYSGHEILVAPPIVPDIAVIHALRADRHGNVVCSAMETDRLAVLAARRAVVTVEEVVPEEAFVARPGEIFLSALHVDAVVVAPRGAHPGSCVHAYGVDRAHMETYLAAARTEEEFRAYLREQVLEATEEGYLSRVRARVP